MDAAAVIILFFKLLQVPLISAPFNRGNSTTVISPADGEKHSWQHFRLDRQATVDQRPLEYRLIRC